MRKPYVFVMEQGLGHAVHTLNLERALIGCSDIDSTILRVRPGETEGVRSLPSTTNWSAQMSWAARRSLQARLRTGAVRGIFIHTQVAALMVKGIMASVPTVVSLDATPRDFDAMAHAYRHETHMAPVESAKLHVNRRALSNAAAIVTWSRWAMRSVVSDYLVPAERVHPIYPGVAMTDFRPCSRDRDPRPLRVLFVGGDFERKGGTDLVEAVASLDGLVELDVVTSPEALPLCTGRGVRCHARVLPNSQELHQLYAKADVFALPSRGDCTPLVIAEAMASGLPVVATPVGSIPDMVRQGHNGLLIPPRRPRELAGAIRALTADPELRLRMGRAGREVAEADHDARKNWRRIFALLDSVSTAKEGVLCGSGW